MTKPERNCIGTDCKRLLVTICLFLVELGFQPTHAQASPVEDEKERTDIREILKLSHRFLQKMGAASESLERHDSARLGYLDLLGEDYGVTVELGGVVAGSGLGAGFTHTFWRSSESVVGWQGLVTHKGYRELGLFHESVLDPAGRHVVRTELRHRDLPREDFFGIGLDTKPQDAVEFALEENVLRSELAVALSDTVHLSVHGDLRRVETRASETTSSRSIAEIDLRGNHDYGGFGLRLSRDTRDNPQYARRGSLISGEVEQFMGLGNLTPSYRHHALELQNALPVSGEGHALVTRFRADWLTHDPDDELPFFLTRGLGGSHSLRSYPLNRFRGEDLVLATVEYRHALLKNTLDAVAFWDTGGVYEDLGDLSFDSLQHSFGLGLRVLNKGKVLVRFEVVQGHGGTRFLFTLSGPF